MSNSQASAPDRAREITPRRVAALALPVVLSNALQPIQGAIDTAIIGNLGDATLLAAVALGATAVSLLFGSFNFLQMGVSGLSAQALGAANHGRVANTLIRALIIAIAVSAVLIAAQGPVTRLVLMLFEGSAQAEGKAAVYIGWRLLGAPAELGLYALIGWFAGQARTRRLFELQLVVSGTNIALNLALVLGFGLGVEGVAIGTALAAWTGLAYGLWRVRLRLAEILPPGWRPERARLLERAELGAVMALNRDIFIRTTLLLFSFAWVARLGSMQGDVVLAANGILLEFFLISSHALDGFAMAAETLVGQAMGAGSVRRLRRAVAVSTLSAVALAAVLSGVFVLGADLAIRGFTNVEAVREVAGTYALWAAFIPLVGVLAYQADGVFIGASRGPAMRNAMIVAAGTFLPIGWLMTMEFGNHGMWGALWLFMGLRAAALAVQYPALERTVARVQARASAGG